jgi:hypothetical protein
MKHIWLISFVFLLPLTSVFSQNNGDTIKIKKWNIGVEGGMCLYKNNRLCDKVFAGYGISVPVSYSVSESVDLGIRISSYFGVFNRNGSYYNLDQQFSDISISCFSKFNFNIGKKSSIYLMPIISNNIVLFKKTSVFMDDNDKLEDNYFQYEIGSAFGYEYKLNKRLGLSANYLFNYSQLLKFKNEINVGFLIRI